MDRHVRTTFLAGLLLLGCGEADGETGNLRVQLVADRSVVDGLSRSQTADYAVQYTKYLVAVGDVHVARTNGVDEVADGAVYIADLRRVGSEGIELTTFKGLATGQWAEVGYRTPAATSTAQALPGVSAEDRAEMIEHGYTYWIEGVVERPEAEGGPVSFVIQTDVDTTFRDCEVNGEPGVAIGEGTSTLGLTLHGDHLFFNAFPSASEASIMRSARFLVDADRDNDGKVSTAELAEIDSAELFTSARGYDLSGSPIVIETALDFVRAQLAGQGHINGEGGCVPEFEGVSLGHDHDHDH